MSSINTPVTILSPQQIAEVRDAAWNVGGSLRRDPDGTLVVTFPDRTPLRMFALFVLALENCSSDWELGHLFAGCAQTLSHGSSGLEVRFGTIAGFTNGKAPQ